MAASREPFMRQVFIKPAQEGMDQATFKRNLFVVRKYSTHTIEKEQLRFYICSLSTDVIVYKVCLSIACLIHD